MSFVGCNAELISVMRAPLVIKHLMRIFPLFSPICYACSSLICCCLFLILPGGTYHFNFFFFWLLLTYLPLKKWISNHLPISNWKKNYCSLWGPLKNEFMGIEFLYAFFCFCFRNKKSSSELVFLNVSNTTALKWFPIDLLNNLLRFLKLKFGIWWW